MPDAFIKITFSAGSNTVHHSNGFSRGERGGRGGGIVEGGHLERGEIGVAEEDLEDSPVEEEEEDLDSNRSVWFAWLINIP